jgi:hypothetical protein
MPQPEPKKSATSINPPKYSSSSVPFPERRHQRRMGNGASTVGIKTAIRCRCETFFVRLGTMGPGLLLPPPKPAAASTTPGRRGARDPRKDECVARAGAEASRAHGERVSDGARPPAAIARAPNVMKTEERRPGSWFG